MESGIGIFESIYKGESGKHETLTVGLIFLFFSFSIVAVVVLLVFYSWIVVTSVVVLSRA